MKIQYTRASQTFALEAQTGANGVQIKMDGTPIPVHVIEKNATRITFKYDDTIFTAHVADDGKKRWVHCNGRTFVLERGETAATRATSHEREGTGAGVVTAPMPGQVRAVLAQVGDWVEQGQPLLLLEAMKMEIRVTATRAGQIVQLDAVAGQTVEREQILAQIQEAEPAST